MKVTFASFAFHDRGDLLVVDGVEADPPPPALPSRLRRWLRVRVETLPQDRADYGAHRALILAVLAHVKANPAGTLVWTDPEGYSTFFSGPVTVIGTNLPEDPNLVGTFEQAIEVTFGWEEAVTAPLLTTSFTPTGGSAVTLGRVTGMHYGATVVRPHELRDLRSRVGAKFSLTGKLDADAALSLAARRAWLETQAAALATAFTARTGTLVHGAFLNRVVRPVDHRIVVNQAEWCVDWTFDGEFNRFPDESDYLLVDFATKTREDRPGGTLERTLSGSIQATNETAAATKLNALISAQTMAGMDWVVETDERDPQTIETPDGTSFVNLTFSIALRKRASATTLREQVTASDAEDVEAGFIVRTYSGQVTGRDASSWTTAYLNALNRAKVLGDNLHPFRLRRRFEVADNQARSNRVVGGDYQVTVNFTYEYRLRAEAKILWEIEAEENTPRFGERTVGVSGYIVAKDETTARTHLAQLKGYWVTGTNFLRDERVKTRKQIVAPSGGAAIGSTWTPGPGNTGEVTNTAEVAATVNGSGAVSIGGNPAYQHFMRLDFSWAVVVPRAADTDVAVRYEFRVDADYTRLSKRTSLSGEVWAANRAAGEFAVTHLLAGFDVAGTFGKLVRSGTGERREKFLGATGTAADDLPVGTAGSEAYQGLLAGWTFQQEYEGRLTGVSGVLECRLSETTRHSGANVVVQPTAFGNDTFQLCGVNSARRSLRGSATAATEASARAWVDAALATPTYGTPTGAAATLPPEITVEWDIEPRTELVARGVSANARLVTVSFSREFVYETHPYAL